jgi:hypothetical protein
VASPCEKKKGIRGLFVETRGGVGTLPICTIGGRTDVLHIVTIENLRTYPAEVTCNGKISSYPPKLKFSSTVSSDTESTWKASKINLDDSESYTFDHVGIRSKTRGTEKVDAIVEIKWPQSGSTKTSLTVSIDVTA